MSEPERGEIHSRIDVTMDADPWVRGMTNKLVEQNALILKANIDLLKMLSWGPFAYEPPKEKK